MLNSQRRPRRGKKLPREDEVPIPWEVVTRGREVAATLILFSLGNPFQCRSLFFTWTMEMKTSSWRRGEDNLKKRWREAEKSGTSDKGDLSLTCSSLMSMFCLSAGRWKWKPPLEQDGTRYDKMWQEVTRGEDKLRSRGRVATLISFSAFAPLSLLPFHFLTQANSSHRC